MRGPGLRRLAAEFLVIVVGVLLALAADRWNQERADADAEAAYINRLIDEIRADSVQMERALALMPSRLAARDTLLGVVNGAEAPPDFVATVLAASGLEVDLNPPNAWRELEAASSLNLIRDAQARRAVTTYYRVTRQQYGRNLTRAQENGRNPFFTTMYRLGVFELDLAFDGTPVASLQAALAGSADVDVDAFREWPEMRHLLNALGGTYLFQAVVASGLIREAGGTIQELEAFGR